MAVNGVSAFSDEKTMDPSAAADGSIVFGFDACTRIASAAVFENARASCAAAGYRLQDPVFRNVDSRSEQQSVTENDRGAAQVSGCSSPKDLKNQYTGFFTPSASPRFAGPDMLFACLHILGRVLLFSAG